MTAQDIRKAYLAYFQKKEHALIKRALLVPQNDPSTLFTGSGMQPLLPNLLGEPHSEGKRLVNSQTCLRVQDIEDVGDNRHTTFFEMLGNWSLGDYFKAEQLPWIFEFLTEVVKLDPNKLYVTCFIGDKQNNIPKDHESAKIWQKLFAQKGLEAKEVEIGSQQDGNKKGMPKGGRIFFYDASKNWWCRAGKINDMPVGEPGGPDSEIFYEFDYVEHNSDYGENCHPNCDCGRFMEIGNSVFMEYVKTKASFSRLPKQNVDFGGGLERIAAAGLNSNDIFKISLLWPIIVELEKLSAKSYDAYAVNMRVIADHLRAATFLAVDNVLPSNKEQGYVMRRLLRRAMRFAFDLGIEQDLCSRIVPVIADIYHDDYPEVAGHRDNVIDILMREEKLFRQTLRKGLREFEKLTNSKNTIEGKTIFRLHDTYGFPVELSLEEAYKREVNVNKDWRHEFDQLMSDQRTRSQTATKGEFKGGLVDHSEITTKYHTATHLLYRALRNILGDHVIQRGSNITAERLRFDFSHPEKMSEQEIEQVEAIVNDQIKKDWPMSWREENTQKALKSGVIGAFGDRYGESVKIYTVGNPDGENFSREICGGPHVEHTGQLGEGSKRLKIIKEESSSAGIRRIKAVLQ
jgi:alanyl-tRNA synthetase